MQYDEMFYVDEDGVSRAKRGVMPKLLADWLYADLSQNPESMRFWVDDITKSLAEGKVFQLSANANHISVGRKCTHIKCLYNSINPPVEIDTEEFLAIIEAWRKFNTEVNPFEEPL